ncbi:MAG: DUF1674 domain-containing protein [Xanthomonadales bacterium]|jgi:hypothetical protein|nr:DUF1674 domain-containing protein [Xanthomonadales bacterium]
MQNNKHDHTPEPDAAAADNPASSAQKTSRPEPDPAHRPKEIGGRKGPDPTRFGDWEKNGRCIDF